MECLELKPINNSLDLCRS